MDRTKAQLRFKCSEDHWTSPRNSSKWITVLVTFFNGKQKSDVDYWWEFLRHLIRKMIWKKWKKEEEEEEVECGPGGEWSALLLLLLHQVGWRSPVWCHATLLYIKACGDSSLLYRHAHGITSFLFGLCFLSRFLHLPLLDSSPVICFFTKSALATCWCYSRWVVSNHLSVVNVYGTEKKKTHFFWRITACQKKSFGLYNTHWCMVSLSNCLQLWRNFRSRRTKTTELLLVFVELTTLTWCMDEQLDKRDKKAEKKIDLKKRHHHHITSEKTMSFLHLD